MSSHDGDTPNTGHSTFDEHSDEDPTISKNGQQNAKRLKRKKASRACFHCQKAHLTCDDSRPCSRCVKRGLESTCQDGVRKKAKYLRDVESEQVQRIISEERSHTPGILQSTVPAMSPDVPPLDGTINLAAVTRQSKVNANGQDTFALFGDNILFDYPPLSSYDFDSKAANLEYSMISTMLGSVATPGTENAHSPDTLSFSPILKGLQHNKASSQHTLHADRNNSMKSDSSHWNQTPFVGAPAPILPTSVNSYKSSLSNAAAQSPPASSAAPSQKATLSGVTHTQRQSVSQLAADPHGQRPTPVARRPLTPGTGADPTNIYKTITTPFSYTNGYHLLNAYLRSRFEKDDLLRIARAIVGYRPSFIALTKTLREEDLTFMEICFQRTLLEYEKFVGYSGTPTIIWRRTGQIELVGKEFCLLTQWSREQLLSKQTFIVELMDDSSVVEYFEKFSQHAFGDTSSVQTTCVLLTPQKRAVPCAFCFTIKRDVFDCPMMIVGNFLPVL